MLKTLDLRGHGTDVASRLPRPVLSGDAPIDTVREIITAVRERGDHAIRELTEKFDGVELEQLRVSQSEIERAVAEAPEELIDALSQSIENVRRFHEQQLRPEETITGDGMTIAAFQRPVRRAGLYVPGGRAAYPSTVVMTAVPANVAGVDEVALCVPPSRETGTVANSVLVAAHLCGVSEIYAIGGAQAIAAMAYGTESVPAVDVIAGPGNVYVALAKSEVSGDVGIAAAFAGPSEVVVVADQTADPRFAAIDVILQAEHGPDGLAWLVTWDPDVAAAVCDAGDELLRDSEREELVRQTLAEGGYVALVDDQHAAVAVVDAIAPEHLELQVAEAEVLARRVRNAGAIFCGDFSPASLGDYMAGPSHVLPTYGSARFASALTVSDFLRDHHIVTFTQHGIRQIGSHVITLAETEGLDAHAESVRLRLLAEEQ